MNTTCAHVARGGVGLALALALGACGALPRPFVEGVQPSAAPAPVAVAVAPSPIVLAEGRVPSLPSAPLAWVADEVSFYDRVVSHRHEAAFVYAAVTPSRLILPTGARALMPGQAVFVPAGVWHTHERTCGPPTECHDSLWEIRLANPATPPPSGDMNVSRAFVSPRLPVEPGEPARVRLELVDPAHTPVASSRTGSVYLHDRRGARTLALRLE